MASKHTEGKVAKTIEEQTAPFLLLGIYNKLVKLEGHDKEDDGE